MIPVLPGQSNAANFIQRYVFNGCARPFYIYLETFAPAFLEMVITISIIDVDDLVRDKLKGMTSDLAKGSGRTRHGPQRAQIQMHKPAQDRWIVGALKTFIMVTQPLENLGLFFLIYGATDKFFYRWHTLLDAAPFCTNPPILGPLQRQKENQGILIGAWALPTLLQDRGSWGSNAFEAFLPFGHYWAFLTLQADGPLGGTPDSYISLEVRQPILTHTFESDHVAMGSRQPHDFAVAAEFFIGNPAGGNIRWFFRSAPVPVGYNSNKGSVSISRVG